MPPIHSVGMSATRLVKKPSGPHQYPDGLAYIDCTPYDAARSTVRLSRLVIGHERTVNYIKVNHQGLCAFGI